MNTYTPEQRIAIFWGTVDVKGPDECWPWTASKNRKGYGQIHWKGYPTKAHRVAFFLSNGYLPEGKDVCHTCDNPSCCNPLHLFPGTNDDNIADRVQKGRSAKGQKNGLAKLTDEQIALIKEARVNGQSLRAIASKHGVTHPTILNVLKGKTWKHLPKR